MNLMRKRLPALAKGDHRSHPLQRFFASQLMIAGVPLKAVQELLGYTDIKMTMRYAHLTPRAKTAYVAVLNEPSL